jgi:methionine-rich copper-binding protein CopC
MTEERIIAYLLEELPEEDSEQFEDECFAQESWPARINLVEEDLIDAYLRDKLTPEQRQRFEQNYLTTDARRERVKIAAAFLRHVDEYQFAGAAVEVKPSESRWAGRFRAFWNNQTWALRAAAALVVVAIIAGVLWLSLSRSSSPRTFATLTLSISDTSNRAEGARAGKVKLPLNADALRLSLMLPDRLPGAARYRVELVSDNGEVMTLEISAQDERSVSAVIPADRLARGQYALNLFTINADGTEQGVSGSYFFTVE